jgi:hypothetical protein
MLNILMDGPPNEERLVVGFIDQLAEESRGTRNMLGLAEDAGIKTLEITL